MLFYNLILIVSLLPLVSFANDENLKKYQKAPQEIQNILDTKMFPSTSISPNKEFIAFIQTERYPSISILAEPMLKLGGLRINTLTNGESSYPTFASSISYRKLNDSQTFSIPVPANARIRGPYWNQPSTRFSFTNTTSKGIELWVVETKNSKSKKLKGIYLNPLLSYEQKWMPDHESILVKVIPKNRPAPPKNPNLPIGPKIEDSTGVKIASSTYEVRDVITNEFEEKLFDFYTQSEILIINTRTMNIKKLGPPSIYTTVLVSPDGKKILVEQLAKPYSYKRTFSRFPKKLQVWDLNGKVIINLPDTPLAEAVPIQGVPTGPRGYQWVNTMPDTLAWIEALDEGNPKVKTSFRDKVMIQSIRKNPKEIFKLEQRFAGFHFIDGGSALVSDYDQEKHWIRTFHTDFKDSNPQLKLIHSLSEDDHYNDPGNPIYILMPNEKSLVLKSGDWIYFKGEGATPDGDRPFLDRLNLQTLKKERLFQSDKDKLESVLNIANVEQGTILTHSQSPTEVPNIFLKTFEPKDSLTSNNIEIKPVAILTTSQKITNNQDPMPQIRGITKQIINYKRADGLDLSFTLYLPPNHQPGKALPTVFYAYPLDYADQKVAGQITGSTKDFTLLGGTSHLFFLMQGYAVLDDVAMPVVGPTDKIYDTYLEQLVMDAKAAVQKAIDIGVADPKRIGVLGHSHGAMMTVNLLAHTDLFKAGIARSGAYNKTLTMFGFQNEKRSLFEANDVYFKVSPTLHADKIKKPLLLIHGEIDSNPGTVPLQSQLLYEAVRGTGGTVRLVMLPYENHGYISRESTEHVMFETINWFDKYVKNAP